MALSEKRRQAIYQAVHDVVMELRITLTHMNATDEIDALVSRAGHSAGQAAIRAAEGKPHA